MILPRRSISAGLLLFFVPIDNLEKVVPKLDQQWMKKALDLARLGWGYASPNPVVGAVIVKNGKVVGTGYHQKAGGPHAEIHALQAAGPEARGGTMYVTLEPCCHYGSTPPCTKAIIQAGIGRVVVAVADPNPQVKGQGIQQLRQAGIEVVTGVMAEEAGLVNEAFFKYITKKTPFCLLKIAMTLDGKIATITGDTRWISGPVSREITHQLRHQYDGIMVGINTVLNDDPQLNTRLPDQEGLDPIRIILDSRLRLPVEAKVCNLQSKASTIVATTANHDEERKKQLEEKGVEVLIVDDIDGKVDIQKLMPLLAQRKITSILIEGGASVAAAALQGEIVDKLYWFIAPKIVGGHQAPTPVGDPGIPFLNQAKEFTIKETKFCGEDLLMILDPKKGGDQ